MSREPRVADNRETSPGAGLGEQEASSRLSTEGPNELPQGKRRTLLRIVIEVLRDPMPQLLLAAGLIYLVIGSAGEAAMLLGDDVAPGAQLDQPLQDAQGVVEPGR